MASDNSAEKGNITTISSVGLRNKWHGLLIPPLILPVRNAGEAANMNAVAVGRTDAAVGAGTAAAGASGWPGLAHYRYTPARGRVVAPGAGLPYRPRPKSGL
jgi:hypothetical protein